MDSPDLQGKYHKLASEYSKLRAQNQVLKKAVVEEQNKTSHLKEFVKSRDQSLRKADQEIDSLSFRNQQLTKRLVLLQDDLQQVQSKTRKDQVKHGVHSGSMIVDKNIYAEELELKIKENARLHAELSDMEEFYKNKVSELEGKLEEAIKEASLTTESMKSHERTLQTEIKKLETERIMREVLQRKEASQRQEGDSELVNGSSAIMYQKNSPPSNLNIVVHNGNGRVVEKVSWLKLMKEFLEPIGQLSDGFVSFFQSYANILKKHSTLSPSHYKLLDQLTEECNVWECMANSYRDLTTKLKVDDTALNIESLSGLDAFSKAVTNCSTALRRVLPILSEKLNLKEDQDDTPWRSSLSSFIAGWAALTPYLMSLAAHSDGRTVLTTCAVAKILSLLNGRLMKLQSTSQELMAAWDVSSSQERDEESVSKSLQIIYESLNKISSLFGEKVSASWSEKSSSSSTPSTFSPGTPQIPHHLALNVLPPDSSWNSGFQDGPQGEEASLVQQLAQSTSRLSKLEEEREHWRLEFQLLSHKFEKESKRAQHLHEELQRLNLSSSKESSDFHSNKVEISDCSSSSSLIGEIIGDCSSSEEREREIRNHFTNRCSHLYMQITACTSQAALYQNECESLIRRLAICDQWKGVLEQDVDLRRKEVLLLQETLNTTTRNYEEQISTMSEHLVDLNEKISNQADTIEELKFEHKRKGKK